MENYDRVVELMDLATESEGKADQQFAKYSDTIEYKLNQLSTKWEEFRVGIADSDIFKSAIDGITELVDRFSQIKFDSPGNIVKNISGIGLGIKGLKNNISLIFNNFKNLAGTGKEIAEEFSESFNRTIKQRFGKKISPKIQIEVEKKQVQSEIKSIENEIEILKSRYGQTELKIIEKLQLNGVKELPNDLTAIQTKLRDIGVAEEDLQNLGRNFAENYNEINIQNEALNDRINKFKQIQNEEQKIAKQSQLTGMVASSAFNAAAVSIGGLLTGTMDAREAFKSFGVTIGTTLIQLGLQIGAEKLLESIRKKNAAAALAEAGAATVDTAAKTGEAAANTAVATTGAAAAASLWAMTWPILVIVGASAGLVGLVAIFIALSNSTSKAGEATQALVDAQERAKEAKDHYNEVSSNAAETKKELENAEELRKKWEELNQLKNANRINEEQEAELAEINNQIRETMPEIVTYYDEQNNKLQVSTELWDSIIDKQKESAKLAAQQTMTAAAYSTATKKDAIDKQLVVDKNILLNQDQIGSYLTDSYYGFGKYENKKWSSTASSKLKIETLFEQDDVTANLDNIAKYFGYDNTKNMSNEDWDSFLNDLKDINSDGWKKINNVTEQYEKNAEKQKQLLDDELNNQRAQYYSEQHDISVGFADALQNTLDDKQYESTLVTEWDVKGRDNTFDYGEEYAYSWESSDIQRKAIEASVGIEKWNSAVKDGGAELVEAVNQVQHAKAELSKEADMEKIQLAFSDEQQKFLSQKIDDFQIQSNNQIENSLTSLKELITDSVLDDDTKNTFINSIETKAKEFEQENKEIIKKIALGFNIDVDEFDNLNKESLNAIKSKMDTNIDTYGTLIGDAYNKSLGNLVNQFNLSPEQFNSVLDIDFSKMNIANQKELDETFVQTLKNAGIPAAEAFYGQIKEQTKKTGAIQLAIDATGLEELQKELDDFKKNITSLGDDIVSVVKDTVKTGEVSLSNFDKISKSLGELGLSAYDYFSIDENGKITADQEALNKMYQDQLKAKKAQLELQLSENKAKLAELQTTKEDLIQKRSSLNLGEASAQQILNNAYATADWARAMQAVLQFYNQIVGNNEQIDVEIPQIDALQYDIDNEAFKQAISEQIDAVDAQMASLKDVNSSLEKTVNNYEPYVNAVWRDYNKELNEANQETSEAQKNAEDLAKAQDDLAKKQETLNEKIKEYNELLNGSDDYRSTLDSLYNYGEAISSYADEISRAKDELTDANNINEATNAIEKQTQATHNLIAEEKARQQVIQSGLKEYEDKLNGSFTYQGITVNYKDYTSKDNITGKYILDQRLLEEASFNDDYKKLLEKEVETYNKYVDEYKKSQDSVRKTEKETQDLRSELIKKYTSLEDTLANTLKEFYDKEVNQLKDKYDSMKEADDDYISALEDAINKQRELRDRENSFNDLAQKEKQLSLMQRDTSGSNQVDVMNLENEIEEDRQKVLDEQIDSIIDELSKMYESQQELRETEIELKEAVSENSAVWNEMASQIISDGFAQGWTGEDFAQFMAEHSTEFQEATAAKQIEMLTDWGNNFDEASQYIALQTLDTVSQTGDYINDRLNIASSEVQDIVNKTSETFVSGIQKDFDETTEKVEADLKKASDAVADARKEVDEATKKINELSNALQNFDSLDNDKPENNNDNNKNYNKMYNQLYNAGFDRHLLDAWFKSDNVEDTLWDQKNTVADILGIDQHVIDEISHSSNAQEDWYTYIEAETNQQNQRVQKQKEREDYLKNMWAVVNMQNNIKKATDDVYKAVSPLEYEMKKIIKNRFAEGGLVDFTGPAWVDGTKTRPEAFLSAEDTERIGNAAKILSDIPWMSGNTDISSNITNNNGGDITVEINLNIDKISSETDIDEMLERVKQEIVDVARPIGTTPILHQN